MSFLLGLPIFRGELLNFRGVISSSNKNPCFTHVAPPISDPIPGSSSFSPYFEEISDTLGLLPLPSKRQLESMGKNTWVFRVYWVIILHSYMGIWINRYKDPYETASISWKVRDPGLFSRLRQNPPLTTSFLPPILPPFSLPCFQWHHPALGVCRPGTIWEFADKDPTNLCIDIH